MTERPWKRIHKERPEGLLGHLRGQEQDVPCKGTSCMRDQKGRGVEQLCRTESNPVAVSNEVVSCVTTGISCARS